MMTIGSLALIGFPFETGLYSKDLILEVAFGKYSVTGFSVIFRNHWCFFTAFYSIVKYTTPINTNNEIRPAIQKCKTEYEYKTCP